MVVVQALAEALIDGGAVLEVLDLRGNAVGPAVTAALERARTATAGRPRPCQILLPAP